MPRHRTVIVATVIVATVFTATVAVLVSLAVIGVRSLNKTFLGPSDATTDVAQYSALLSQWTSTGLVDHFPTTIPDSAQSVRFSAFPGALQGRPWIQLRLQLPPHEIAVIEASSRGLAGKVYPGGGDEFDHFNADPKHEWPTAAFHTADASKGQLGFPKTYTFYVIKAVDQGMGSWDPYDGCGIAISAETNEVVYWATR